MPALQAFQFFLQKANIKKLDAIPIAWPVPMMHLDVFESVESFIVTPVAPSHPTPSKTEIISLSIQKAVPKSPGLEFQM